jgi:hypothetical protein
VLAPGQAFDVTLHVAPRKVSYWSSAGQQWVLGPGARQSLVDSPSGPNASGDGEDPLT